MKIKEIWVKYDSFSFTTVKVLLISITQKYLGGGKMIEEDLQESIYEYLKNNSSIASNRLVKRKDSSGKCQNDLIPARYLDDNQSEMFKRFPFNNEISRSTFLKYLNKNGVFKHPTRLTNICDYCEWARNTKKDVIKMLKSNSNV